DARHLSLASTFGVDPCGVVSINPRIHRVNWKGNVIDHSFGQYHRGGHPAKCVFNLHELYICHREYTRSPIFPRCTDPPSLVALAEFPKLNPATALCAVCQG